jgi:hypothetical protein
VQKDDSEIQESPRQLEPEPAPNNVATLLESDEREEGAQRFVSAFDGLGAHMKLNWMVCVIVSRLQLLLSAGLVVDSSTSVQCCAGPSWVCTLCVHVQARYVAAAYLYRHGCEAWTAPAIYAARRPQMAAGNRMRKGLCVLMLAMARHTWGVSVVSVACAAEIARGSYFPTFSSIPPAGAPGNVLPDSHAPAQPPQISAPSPAAQANELPLSALNDAYAQEFDMEGEFDVEGESETDEDVKYRQAQEQFDRDSGVLALVSCMLHVCPCMTLVDNTTVSDYPAASNLHEQLCTSSSNMHAHYCAHATYDWVSILQMSSALSRRRGQA